MDEENAAAAKRVDQTIALAFMGSDALLTNDRPVCRAFNGHGQSTHSPVIRTRILPVDYSVKVPVDRRTSAEKERLARSDPHQEVRLTQAACGFEPPRRAWGDPAGGLQFIHPAGRGVGDGQQQLRRAARLDHQSWRAGGLGRAVGRRQEQAQRDGAG